MWRTIHRAVPAFKLDEMNLVPARAEARATSAAKTFFFGMMLCLSLD